MSGRFSTYALEAVLVCGILAGALALWRTQGCVMIDTFGAPLSRACEKCGSAEITEHAYTQDDSTRAYTCKGCGHTGSWRIR